MLIVDRDPSKFMNKFMEITPFSSLFPFQYNCDDISIIYFLFSKQDPNKTGEIGTENFVVLLAGLETANCITNEDAMRLIVEVAKKAANSKHV